MYNEKKNVSLWLVKSQEGFQSAENISELNHISASKYSPHLHQTPLSEE